MMRFAVVVAAIVATFPSMASAEDAVKARVPGDGIAFSDCEADCPAMVVIPGTDHAIIGSPVTEAGRLPSEAEHEVAIEPFALGTYEVSVREYLACVEARACRDPEWREAGGEHNMETGRGVTYKAIKGSIAGAEQPVVGISWDDAQAYAVFLSGKTGHRYRLPSEAEWEYAARAGSRSAYWWGDEVTRGGDVMACCRGCGSEQDAKGFFPVKSMPPNPWGLHNMHGNVWEWVEDFYCEDYGTAPRDGSARADKTCQKSATAAESPDGLRIFRGGSCFYDPRQMRSSMRLRNWPAFRNQTIGFRVARDLQK